MLSRLKEMQTIRKYPRVSLRSAGNHHRVAACLTHHPDRIIYPMKRAVEDRGKDKWERVSWDETIETIVDKVRYFWETYGHESIVCFGGTGREACIYYYALTFSVLQSPNCCYTPTAATRSLVGPATVRVAPSPTTSSALAILSSTMQAICPVRTTTRATPSPSG